MGVESGIPARRDDGLEYAKLIIRKHQSVKRRTLHGHRPCPCRLRQQGCEGAKSPEHVDQAWWMALTTW